MDLVAGVASVLVLMYHFAKKKDGTIDLNILPACTLPLTGVGVVNRIITDLAVLDVTPNRLTVVEIASGVSRWFVPYYDALWNGSDVQSGGRSTMNGRRNFLSLQMKPCSGDHVGKFYSEFTWNLPPGPCENPQPIDFQIFPLYLAAICSL
jgi:hypothetical protein